MAKFFGTPDGVKIGDLFVDRKEVRDAHVHMPLQSGISGNAKEGADSIVLSGGYSDEDFGDHIIYTGHGGRAPGSTTHIKDQSVEGPGNAGLITSQVLGLPVRVVRGADSSNPFAPPKGYRYDGLFLITEWWIKERADGFAVVQFLLERIPGQAHLWTKEEPVPDPAFATTTISRRIRDTQLSREVKSLYEHQCQICATTIPGIGGRYYSEGAHVKPLGKPHLGADALNNLLSLCPNHHTQLDIGGMVILNDLTVAKTSDLTPFAELSFRKDHKLDVANAQYHRSQWGFA